MKSKLQLICVYDMIIDIMIIFHNYYFLNRYLSLVRVLVVRLLLLCVCSRDVLAPAVLRPLRILSDPVHGPRHPREHRGEVLDVAPSAVHLRHEAGHPDHGLPGRVDIIYPV